MLTQGEAVYKAVISVMGKQDGAAYEPTQAQLEVIRERVIASFKSGETNHSKNPNPEQLRKYVPGLVNNWLRKDLRLNGGIPYVAKNPGSRSRHSIARPQVRQPAPSPVAVRPPQMKATQAIKAIEAQLAELRTLVAH